MPMPFSPAGQALFGGLGQIPGLGDQLGEQVSGLTDEEKRRRQQQLQQQRLLGVGGNSVAGSAAGTALGLGAFSGGGGYIR